MESQSKIKYWRVLQPGLQKTKRKRMEIGLMKCKFGYWKDVELKAAGCDRQTTLRTIEISYFIQVAVRFCASPMVNLAFLLSLLDEARTSKFIWIRAQATWFELKIIIRYCLHLAIYLNTCWNHWRSRTFWIVERRSTHFVTELHFKDPAKFLPLWKDMTYRSIYWSHLRMVVCTAHSVTFFFKNGIVCQKCTALTE